MNRVLPDEIFRRQLINNLAKHILYSKGFANMTFSVLNIHL